MKNDRRRNSTQLNIWLIQHGEPTPVLPDSAIFRTARLSKELASRGHDVTYWTSSFLHHKKVVFCEENQVVEVDGYKLHILHAGKYAHNHSIERYLHHKKMARLFAEEARKIDKPDIIIAAHPIHYCAFEAVKYGNQNQVPVVVDIRDDWPANFLLVFPKQFRWMVRIVFWNDFRVTRHALKNATVLVSMMNHLLDWGIEKYAHRSRGSDDRVFYLGGDTLSISDDVSATKLYPEIEIRTRGRFVVNYVGSFSHFNHPTVIIEAAKYLNSMGLTDRFYFLLVGSGDYYESCVKAAKELDNVAFLGWVDTARMVALNSMSSVGVIPSIEKYTFPNKAFSYLGSGLPVLSSAHGDLENLLAEHHAGFYFNISDPTDLAKKILDLSRLDSDSYNRLSENARNLFEGYLQADKIYRQYADHIENVAYEYQYLRQNGV